MKKIDEFAALLCSQGVPQPVVRQVTALKSTTSPENVLTLLKMCAMQWYADTLLSPDTESELPMSSKGCSALH
jgi:hypothetical protein